MVIESQTDHKAGGALGAGLPGQSRYDRLEASKHWCETRFTLLISELVLESHCGPKQTSW